MKFLPFIFLAVTIPTADGFTLFSPTDPYKPVESKKQSHSYSFVSSGMNGPKVSQRTITLKQAIEIGLSNNSGITAARWDSEAARARRHQAIGQQLPRISLVGSYTHYLDNQRLFPAGLPGDPTLLSKDISSGDIVLTFPIFNGGRLVNQTRAAELLYQASAHDLSRSREELVFNITSIYYTILAQHQVIKSQEFSLNTLEEHVKRIDALMQARKAANVDKLRTEVQLANVHQQLVRERNLIAIQYRILKNLLGTEEYTDTLTLQGDLSIDTSGSVISIDTSITAALNSRDDYLAAKVTVEAQARKIDIAKSSCLPSVYLRGSYGVRSAIGQTVGTGNDLGDAGGVGLSMEMPIFEGGKLLAIVKEQQANLAAAQERLLKIKQQVRFEVESAVLSIQSSRERLNAIMKSIEQAKEGYRIEQQKYNLGNGAIVDVLDAQNALLESETTYYRVLAEFHIAQAQLKLARGEE